ncbi:MAG: spore maturation protein [Oscillospiraceae bacterium]|nr:spore maturation protein [Oscillospiraceae bacterium]
MTLIGSMTVPLILLLVAAHGLSRRVDVYGNLVSGAGDGLKILLNIIPALIALLTAIGMMRASGLLDWLTVAVTPVFSFLGIPPETAPLVLLRPFSGSGALALGADIMQTHGVDSLAGRTAAVMLGSTETTFYTMTVYLGGAGVSKAKFALPVALLSDLVGMTAAAFFVRFFS